MSSPILFQRLEGGAIFAAATSVYFYNDLSWILYIVLLFAFDIFAAGYFLNPRVGALVYNLGHSMIAPSLIAILYLFERDGVTLGLTCLWFAHIGIDRAAGYGLKLPSGFHHTHLGDLRAK